MKLESIITISKKEIKKKAEEDANYYSEIGALEAFVNASKLSDYFNELKNSLLESAKNELHREGGTASINGVNLQFMQAGTRYDFSNCNHKQYNEVALQIAQLSEKLKAYERELKSLKEGKLLVCEDTGEVYRISPPKVKSTETIKISYL